MNHEFEEFLNSIKYLDKQDILTTAYQKHKALDKMSAQGKKEGGTAFRMHLEYLLYFLEKEERPEGITDEAMALLKPLCENLFKKHQIAPETMALF